MTTPTGNPSWLRSVGFEDYGGHAQKKNYQDQSLVNPRTDIGAEGFTRMTSDLAAAVRTVPFATITCTCNDTSPAAPTVQSVHMQTGVTAVPYAGASPPTGFPTFARTGTGAFTCTFSSSYNDAYGVAGSFGITHAEATGHGTTVNTPTVEFTAGAQVVTVRCFNAAGSALTDAKVTFEVW